MPVRALSVAFLIVLALAVAEASQITGALLVFALLVVPAATAQAVTARPLASAGLSVGLAVVTVWLGLAIAYFTDYPIGFTVTTVAFAGYIGVRGARGLASHRFRLRVSP